MEQTYTRHSPVEQGVADMANRGPGTGKRENHD